MWYPCLDRKAVFGPSKRHWQGARNGEEEGRAAIFVCIDLGARAQGEIRGQCAGDI